MHLLSDWACKLVLIRKWVGKEEALHQCVHLMLVWVQTMTTYCCCITLCRMHTNTHSHGHTNTKGVEYNDTITHKARNVLIKHLCSCKSTHAHMNAHTHTQNEKPAVSALGDRKHRRTGNYADMFHHEKQVERRSDARGEKREKKSYLVSLDQWQLQLLKTEDIEERENNRYKHAH